MDTLTASSSPATRHSLSGRFLRFVLSLSLLLLAAAQASAQYGGGGGTTGTLGTPGYVPPERMGQKSKADSGAQTFAAKKLVKDLGSCDASTSAAQTQPAGN
jgi:hypothetical protein